MKRITQYLNPLSHLGDGHYSFIFPVLANIFITVCSEIFSVHILKNPQIVGVYIIYLNVMVLLYFAFREGVKGGLVTAVASSLYYFYIIYTRHYVGPQFNTAVETTIVLTSLYIVIGSLVGWLKQSIDKLIEREADGRRRLETIIEQLPVGVLITDSNGVLIQRNKVINEILGVKMPLGFRIGVDTLKETKINGKPMNPAESPLFQALQSGKPVIGKEFTFERQDGKRISIQVNSAPILNKKNKVIAAASIISNVTRQKDLERQKDDFLGIASHELKTPVTSIKAYGQVLQKMFQERGDGKAVDQLHRMNNQVNRLTTLIEDLLDVTKIQSGQIEFHREPFQINQLIREIVDEIQVATKKHTIVMKLDKNQKLLADRERVGQVIANLIGNGIKYSPEADKLIVRTMVLKKSVTISIQDFGIGIPKDKQAKVFDQFFRATSSGQRSFSGLGLGLYVSQEIVQREHGKIWLESEEGKGSTFFISLPILEASKRRKAKTK